MPCGLRHVTQIADRPIGQAACHDPSTWHLFFCCSHYFAYFFPFFSPPFTSCLLMHMRVHFACAFARVPACARATAHTAACAPVCVQVFAAALSCAETSACAHVRSHLDDELSTLFFLLIGGISRRFDAVSHVLCVVKAYA